MLKTIENSKQNEKFSPFNQLSVIIPHTIFDSEWDKYWEKYRNDY